MSLREFLQKPLRSFPLVMRMEMLLWVSLLLLVLSTIGGVWSPMKILSGHRTVISPDSRQYLNPIGPSTPLKPKRTLYLETTGYSNHENCPRCTDTQNGRTATGLLARYGTCAVDPAYLPLGTVLFVPSYGPCWATDTGRVIKGAIADLYFDSQGEAEEWGRRVIEVQVLGWHRPQ